MERKKSSEIKASTLTLPIAVPGGLGPFGPTNLTGLVVHKVAIFIIVVVLLFLFFGSHAFLFVRKARCVFLFGNGVFAGLLSRVGAEEARN